MQKLQSAAKVIASLALVAVPIVSHSIYGADAHVQMALSLITMALGVFGFTVAKPFIVGDPAEWQRTHKVLATLGMLGMVILPALSQSVLGTSPAVKLGLDLAAAFLGLCGFVAVRPLAGGAAAGAMLPFFLVGTLLASSCMTPGGQALQKCELATLPSAVGAIAAKLLAIAFSGGNYDPQLEQAGEQAAADNLAPQFNCALQAVLASLQGTKGQISPDRAAAIKAFKAYAAKHPATACGPAPAVATLLLEPSIATVYPEDAWRNHTVSICDSGTEGGADACRPVLFNDDMPMTLSVPSGDFWRHATPAVTLAAPKAP